MNFLRKFLVLVVVVNISGCKEEIQFNELPYAYQQIMSAAFCTAEVKASKKCDEDLVQLSCHVSIEEMRTIINRRTDAVKAPRIKWYKTR